MEVDIHRPSDCIKRVVQYRKTVFDKIEKKKNQAEFGLKRLFGTLKKLLLSIPLLVQDPVYYLPFLKKSPSSILLAAKVSLSIN